MSALDQKELRDRFEAKLEDRLPGQWPPNNELGVWFGVLVEVLVDYLNDAAGRCAVCGGEDDDAGRCVVCAGYTDGVCADCGRRRGVTACRGEGCQNRICASCLEAGAWRCYDCRGLESVWRDCD